MIELATQTIDETHSLWEKIRAKNPRLYRHGYAVFYSPVRFRPDVMLVGINPGGRQNAGADFQKEMLRDGSEDMEYIRYRESPNYPLASRTAEIFEHAGFLSQLGRSVKINLNFFRSPDQRTMPTKVSPFCQEKAITLIRELQPTVLFCESMGVLNKLERTLFADSGRVLGLERKRKNGNCLYRSFWAPEPGLPTLTIGVSHLTGSRLSKQEFDVIGNLLGENLSEVL